MLDLRCYIMESLYKKWDQLYEQKLLDYPRHNHVNLNTKIKDIVSSIKFRDDFVAGNHTKVPDTGGNYLLKGPKGSGKSYVMIGIGTTAMYHFNNVLYVYHDYEKKGFKYPYELILLALRKRKYTWKEYLQSMLNERLGMIDYADNDQFEDLLRTLSRQVTVVFCADEIQELYVADNDETIRIARQLLIIGKSVHLAIVSGSSAQIEQLAYRDPESKYQHFPNLNRSCYTTFRIPVVRDRETLGVMTGKTGLELELLFKSSGGIPRRFQNTEPRTIDFNDPLVLLIFTNIATQMTDNMNVFDYPSLSIRLTKAESFKMQDKEIVYEDPLSGALSLLVPGDMDEFIKFTIAVNEYDAYKLLYLASRVRLDINENRSLEGKILKLYARQKQFVVHDEPLVLAKLTGLNEKTIYQYNSEIEIDGFMFTQKFVYFFQIKALSKYRQSDLVSLLGNAKSKFFQGKGDVLRAIPNSDNLKLKVVFIVNAKGPVELEMGENIEVEMIVGDAYNAMFGLLSIDPLLWEAE
eukprot:NODE_139_length_17940_cov_0.254190.p3 type:complete len:522 gc:universal NODE_139_length_17940_cov_0.254190:2228-3793(+)